MASAAWSDLPRLRQNWSDPALRSGFAEQGTAVQRHARDSPRAIGTPPGRFTTTSAPGSVTGDSISGDSPARASSYGAVTRSGPKSDATLELLNWRPAGLEQFSRKRGRIRGDRHPLYVPAVNANPIPLRGGGRGGAGGLVAETSTPSTSSAAAVLPSSALMLPVQHEASVGASRITDEATRQLIACSIATPDDTPVRSDQSPISSSAGRQFHRQLQDTRDRLTTLEAEQRKLINTSLGALVKAACAMSSPVGMPLERLPNSSTFSCRSLLSATSDPLSDLPTDTPSAGSLSPASTGALLVGKVGSALSSEKLEDENRRLRDAIAKTTIKNGELAAMCQAAEARSRLLEEENRSATQELTKHDSELEDGPPIQAPTADRPDAGAAEKALRDLLFTSSDVDRRLTDLFTRRGNLQAVMQAKVVEAPGDLGQEASAR